MLGTEVIGTERVPIFGRRLARRLHLPVSEAQPSRRTWASVADSGKKMKKYEVVAMDQAKPVSASTRSESQ